MTSPTDTRWPHKRRSSWPRRLITTLQSRQVIGEAVGMLRERFDLPSSRAFDVLKRLSSQQNTKLFKIAQHIVDIGNLPDLSHSPNDDGLPP